MTKTGYATGLITVMISSSVAFSQSPFRTSWSVDGPILGTGAAVGIASLAIADDVRPLTIGEVNSLSRSDVNAFDRGATYNYSASLSSTSDWLVFAAIASPLGLLSQESVRSDWQTYLVMYIEAIGLSGVTTELVKGTLSRTRPLAYNPNAPLEPKIEQGTRRSFYSGHTASAFASAVFLSTTFGDYFPSSSARGFVWAGSIALATAVGSLRYASGDHFPTDILTGAAVGSAFGYLIPLLHRTETGQFSCVPVTTGNAVRLDMVYRF